MVHPEFLSLPTPPPTPTKSSENQMSQKLTLELARQKVWASKKQLSLTTTLLQKVELELELLEDLPTPPLPSQTPTAPTSPPPSTKDPGIPTTSTTPRPIIKDPGIPTTRGLRWWASTTLRPITRGPGIPTTRGLRWWASITLRPITRGPGIQSKDQVSALATSSTPGENGPKDPRLHHHKRLSENSKEDIREEKRQCIESPNIHSDDMKTSSSLPPAPGPASILQVRGSSPPVVCHTPLPIRPCPPAPQAFQQHPMLPAYYGPLPNPHGPTGGFHGHPRPITRSPGIPTTSTTPITPPPITRHPGIQSKDQVSALATSSTPGKDPRLDQRKRLSENSKENVIEEKRQCIESPMLPAYYGPLPNHHGPPRGPQSFQHRPPMQCFHGPPHMHLL